MVETEVYNFTMYSTMRELDLPFERAPSSMAPDMYHVMFAPARAALAHRSIESKFCLSHAVMVWPWPSCSGQALEQRACVGKQHVGDAVATPTPSL